MKLHESKLAQLPCEPAPEKVLLALEYRFDATPERSEMHLLTHGKDLSRTLLEMWGPYREQGAKYMGGHDGYLYLAIPDPLAAKTIPARLHIAVRYIDFDDLNRGHGTEYREDFDRLMDLARKIMVEMVDASFIEMGRFAVEIVSEPLSPASKLDINRSHRLSEDIGISWLFRKNQPIFSHFLAWDPKIGAWSLGH